MLFRFKFNDLRDFKFKKTALNPLENIIKPYKFGLFLDLRASDVVRSNTK
jgi:hypothetical protein